MIKSTPFRMVAILFPAVGIIIGLPLATGPFAGDPRGFFGPYFFTALPVYAAVLAAPGYLTCLLGAEGAKASSPGRRWWIRASLLLAILSGAAGIWGASLMFLFGPPALVAFACAVVLWTRFERDPPSSQPA